ncbi:hypothetical protein [Lysobacter sp. P5_B9]
MKSKVRVERFDQALSLASAASLLRIGEEALRALVVTGQIPALSLNSRHWILLREDVIEFIRVNAQTQQDQRMARWTNNPSCSADPEDTSAQPRKRGRGRPRKTDTY